MCTQSHSHTPTLKSHLCPAASWQTVFVMGKASVSIIMIICFAFCSLEPTAVQGRISLAIFSWELRFLYDFCDFKVVKTLQTMHWHDETWLTSRCVNHLWIIHKCVILKDLNNYISTTDTGLNFFSVTFFLTASDDYLNFAI